jgi:hypothetical protein
MPITPTNPFKGRQTRADILGTLWEEFDILDVEETIGDAVYVGHFTAVSESQPAARDTRDLPLEALSARISSSWAWNQPPFAIQNSE